MHADDSPDVPPPALVALAGWAVPGLGYGLIGHRARGVVAGATVLLLYVGGLLIGGVRVVDVPGHTYDGAGQLRTAGFTLARALPLLMEKPWFIPQSLAGPITFVAASASNRVAAAYPGVKTTARLYDIGTLYTAVAGMLNLFVVIDAAHRAGQIRDADPRPGPM